MTFAGADGASGFFCAALLLALVAYLLYWVIRLAVRHALTDVGVRRLVLRSYRRLAEPDDGDEPADPGTDDGPSA